MAVAIKSVDDNSPCGKHGVRSGYTLVSLNGHEINDVLDYRFYGNAKRLRAVFRDCDGNEIELHLKTGGSVDELGLGFETYLMDKQQHCKNKCIFCFIDQLPKGMRESLYFKDDDSRMSFFFGNYVTLTNMSEKDVDRICELHISPVNVSVHTMNPELRVKMMANPNAGKVLSYLDKIAGSGIEINAQLVLCPGINDGEELKYSLEKLSELGNSIGSVAAVPVGLSDHREGLCHLDGYNKTTAGEVIDIIDNFNREHFSVFGRNFAYAADEFYLKAEREMPECEYYDDFPQLDNGVGLWSLTKSDFYRALNEESGEVKRNVALITGVAASPLINEFAGAAMKKIKGLNVKVYTIINDFFGHDITVAGLVTGQDIIKQVENLEDFDIAIIPSVMMRDDGAEVFLDNVTLEELSEKLKVKVIHTPNDDGRELLYSILGKESE